MDIIKLKLVKMKGGHCLTFFYKEQDPTNPEDGLKNKKALIHQKLYDAVQGLAIHYAILQGYVSPKLVEDIALPDPALTENFTISGYSIGGDDENPGIMISGTLKTFRKKASNGNSPFDAFECAPEARYQYMDDLLAKLRVIEHHVAKYLSGEERGEPEKGIEEKEPPKKKAEKELFDQEPLGEVDGEKINKMQVLPDETAGGRKDIGKKAEKRTHIPQADAEAMKRVAEGDLEDKANGKKGGRKKPVVQSADHPDGQKEVADEE